MRVILPQIAQITQRGMQQAALSRRERQIGVSLVWGIVVLLFICEICGRLLGFFCASIKEETQETVAARMQQTVTVSHFVASQATTKI